MTARCDRRTFLAATAGLTVLGRAIADTTGKRTGLVNGQPQAAEAGNAVLAAGGNAVDAVVAAALLAGVVAVPMTGIGGYGGHLVIAGLPRGKVTAIDFNTAAPASAKPDMYGADDKGAVKDQANTYGWRAVGVPGVLAGLQLALDKYGSKSFKEVVKPAIAAARDGFAVSRGFANAAKGSATRLAKDPASAKLLLKDGQPPAEGATFKNPDLAAMLQTLADRGSVATFYKGDIADKLAEAFKASGGLVTAADLAAYKAVERTPLSLEWNGYTLHTPPPTAGSLTMVQTLAALKALDWPGKLKEPDRTRFYLEALRVAWTDRLELLGDPDHADVPVKRLLSADHARQTADRVRAALKAGKPVEGKSDGRTAGGTIHLNAIDASGLAVALTFTHGGYFGAQVTAGGLGLVLGHGLSRFDPRAGRPNSPGPGKRPLHNMCPTVVTKDGKPVLTVGATGGRRIVNAVARALAARVGEDVTVADAVAAPRVHTEGDLALIADPKHPAADHLTAAGYKVTAGSVATLHAIDRDSSTGEVRPSSR